jgi:hypothetical protein
MKMYLLFVATLALLAFPAVCLCSYLIELNNGRQFVVDQHWEEAGKIAFYFHGGVVAIPKHLVKKISESDVRAEPGVSSLEDTAAGRGVHEETVISSGKPGEGQAQDSGSEIQTGLKTEGTHGEVDLEHYRRQRLLLKSRLEEATQRFRKASASRGLEAKKRAIQDITKTSKEMLDLSRELQEKNDGVLPEWWDQP